MKSWLKYRLRTAAILLTATLFTTSCLQSDFDEPLLAGDTVKVSFNVGVDNDMVTRVGEGGNINSLLVAIYKENNDFVSAEIDNATVTDGKISGNLDFELLRNQNYKAVFFAYNTTGYDVSDDFQTITANYGVSNPELLDAFRGAIEFTATANTSLSTTLTRAVALFVVGAKNENFKSGDVTLSLPSAPTAFSTLTGATSDTSNISLTFTPNGSYVDGNNAYTLLAMTYVLPGTIQPTITTVDGDKQVANAITFAANKRYNLLGDSLFVNFSWGGEIEITSLPAENVDSDGWIHIKTAEELAYLIKNGDNATVAAGANISSTRADGVKKYHICPGADLDMSMWKNEDKPTTAVSFTNTIIDAGKWDEDTPTVNQTCEDGCYTIEGLTLTDGIFGNANGVTVQNLNIEGATIGSNTAEGVGIIANTATGSLTLTNITVSGTVTGKNKVGGLVGYISNSKDNEATISNCHSTATVTTNNESDKTNHEIFVGGLVGCFRGDTKDEELTFEGNCSANETGYFTPFCDDEQACFNSDCTVTENLLGGEENCRGSVYYGESRFFYRWDGVRKVTPLTENSSTSIYSPYDLADCQGKSITSMTFHNDVDMGGTEADFNKTGTSIRDDMSFKFTNEFKSLNSVSTLDGKNCTIYNLRIDRRNTGSGAFILNGGGTHKNLTFDGAYIVVTHVTPITNANAYAGTLSAMNYSTYTIENVDCKNGKIFAICKMGGLIGGFAKENSAKLTCKNCDIDNYYLENYVVDYDDTFNVGQTTTIAGMQVSGTATQTFITSGEVGGLIGFIKGNAEITHCSVKNSVINCYGQPDLETRLRAVVGTSGSLDGYGYYLVAGRHVNQFIGDLYPIGISTVITLQNNTISNNSYGANNSVNQHNNHFYQFSRQKKNEGKPWNPKNYAYYTIKKETPYAGCVYYVGIQMEMGGTTYTFADELGTVKIDDLTLDSIGEVVGGPVNDISLFTDLNKINKTIRLVYDLN